MKQKDLKDTIKDQVRSILLGEAEPPPWKLKALEIGLKVVAVELKMEESEYGGFFGEEPSGISEREESPTRRLKRGNGRTAEE